MSRWLAVLAISVLGGAACKRRSPEPSPDDAPETSKTDTGNARDASVPTPVAGFEAKSAWTSIGTGERKARPDHEHLMLRGAYPLRQPYGNLIYEGNNAATRGAQSPEGLFRSDGQAVARRWREIAAQVRAIFVLRDSLFNQQDHPFRHRAFAPMIPPSWITVAVGATQKNVALVLPVLPDATDDDAWATLDAPRAFGRFPPSESLLETARGRSRGASPDIGAQILNSRATLAALHVEARAMLARAGEGPQAVAREGAIRIAASDRLYFGAGLRRTSVIPIFVENPTRHEAEEGKGLLVPGHDLTTATAARVTRDALCRQRLRDGDIALERYDLSDDNDQRRAIEILEALLPAGESGHTVWLWVTGPLDADAKLKGEDATAYIGAFRELVARAPIESRRLRFVTKPDFALPIEGRADALEAELRRFKALGLPFGANLYGPQLSKLVP